jgi:hypothetical protein
MPFEIEREDPIPQDTLEDSAPGASAISPLQDGSPQGSAILPTHSAVRAVCTPRDTFGLVRRYTTHSPSGGTTQVFQSRG